MSGTHGGGDCQRLGCSGGGSKAKVVEHGYGTRVARQCGIYKLFHDRCT